MTDYYYITNYAATTECPQVLCGNIIVTSFSMVVVSFLPSRSPLCQLLQYHVQGQSNSYCSTVNHSMLSLSPLPITEGQRLAYVVPFLYLSSMLSSVVGSNVQIVQSDWLRPALVVCEYTLSIVSLAFDFTYCKHLLQFSKILEEYVLWF